MTFEMLLAVFFILAIATIVILFWQQRIYRNRLSQLRTLIDKLPEGIVLIDDQQRVVDYNASATAFASGTSHLSASPLFQDAFAQFPALESWQSPDHTIVSIPTDDGQNVQVVSLQKSKHPFSHSDRATALITIKDISEFKQTEQQLTKAKLDTEKTSLSKSKFLATLTHELRTPLNAIIGYSEILQDSIGRLEKEKLTDYYKRIEKSGYRLNAMLIAITDIAKFEIGQKKFDIVPIPVHSLIDEVVFVCQNSFSDQKYSLHLHHLDKADQLQADETLLRQVLITCLETAIKSSQKGTVSLTVTHPYPSHLSLLHSTNRARQWISFHICNYRAELPDKVMSNEAISTLADNNLDLAISHRFCQLIGGGITIITEAEGEMTISVHIPSV